MKYIIDTDKLIEDIRGKTEFEKRDRVLEGMRGLMKGVVCVPWLDVVKKPTKPKVPPCPVIYTGRFDTFWAAWPKCQRKTAKRSAFKHWWRIMHTLLPEDVLLRECLGTLQWQKESESWTKENGDWIPLPSTWLNAERWNDEDPNEGKGMEDYLHESGDIRQRRVT